MADKDAKVRIGVEGDAEVARAADRCMRPWQTASAQATSAVRSMGGAVSDTFKQVASDVSRGIAGFAAFDLGSRIPAVITYRDEVARLSVVAAQSSDQLRQKFAGQEAAILSARGENEKFASSFGRLTYNYKDATDAAKALGQEAIASNRSLGEMAGAGKVLYDATGTISGMEQGLGRIRAQANALGTVGGPDALRDQIESLGSAISKLSARSPEELGKITALVGGLGKGMRPEAAQRAAAGVLGTIESNPYQWERYLRHHGALKQGESIVDEYGHVRDSAGVAEKIRNLVVQRRGGRARRVLSSMFGMEGGAGLMNADFDEMRRAATLAPSTGAADATTGYAQSEEGRRKLAEIKTRGAQADVAANALPAVDAVLGFAASHPILAGAGALLGPGLASKGLGFLLSKGGGTALRALGGAATQIAGGAISAASGGAAGIAPEGAAAYAKWYAEQAAIQGGRTALMGGGAGLGGFAAGGLASTAAGLLGPAYLIYQGLKFQGKALAEIGEDRETMGRRWREEHAGAMAPGVRKGDARQIVQALVASRGDPVAAYGRLGKPLIERINQSPELQAVAQGVLGGNVNMAALPKNIGDEVATALKGAPLQIQIINQTGGPIEALDEQGANPTGDQ